MCGHLVAERRMFDGTDLSVAYGSMYEEPRPAPALAPSYGQGPVGAPEPTVKEYAAPRYEDSSPPQPGQKYAQRNPSTYAYEEPPRAPLPPVEAPAPVPSPVYVAPTTYGQGPTFWERLAARKGEVYKLFAFSLVIVLAVAIHYVASHYINQYVGQAFLSDLQEFLVRLSYPVIVILVIWIMKAL